MNLLAGGLAGAASLALVYPFEFATIRLAAELGPDAQHAAAGAGAAGAKAAAGAAGAGAAGAPAPHMQLSHNSRVTRAGIGQLWHMVGGQARAWRQARAAPAPQQQGPRAGRRPLRRPRPQLAAGPEPGPLSLEP
jgi:hypothetical protein